MLFEHVTTLPSFIFALALTHLPASATDIVLNRARVRFSWVQRCGWSTPRRCR